MKKRILALLCAATLSIGLLTGCGGSSSKPEEKAGETETITVAASAVPHADILNEAAMPAPEKYDINRYTREVFRMFDNEKTRKVTLVCDNSVMKGIIDQFGTDVIIKHKDKNHFIAKVRACTSPTFYGWVFQWGGQIKITAPKAAVEEYREMARKVLEQGG